MRSRDSINSLEVNNGKLKTESILGIYPNFLRWPAGPPAARIRLTGVARASWDQDKVQEMTQRLILCSGFGSACRKSDPCRLQSVKKLLYSLYT